MIEQWIGILAWIVQEDQRQRRPMTNPIRTDLDCTNCRRNFIAQLDYALDGNHIVECPYCGHEHCRVIENGKVTQDRWSSRQQRIDVDKRCVWKCDSRPIVTSTAAAFIREAWLNRCDVQL